MTKSLLRPRTIWMLLTLMLAITSVRLSAQATTTYSGAVLDPKGSVVADAAVTLRNDTTQDARSTATDASGNFSFTALPEGTYSLEIMASGFENARRSDIHLTADAPGYISISLAIHKVDEQITVSADEVPSIAADLAPMTQSLAATSARSQITSTFIRNYLPPTADFGEIVQMVPGTFTTNPNGVGLGQSNTYFRGFPDGSYDIDFDGIPFYDTNTPSHHSWAFFPAQWIGSTDFDRSPGTASTIGPTPFGGSIHLLSHEVSPVRSLRFNFNYGSWNTKLYDVAFDSGSLLSNHKLSLMMDVHHMSSDGYQTYNFVQRNAGSIKVQYLLASKTVLSGYSGVVKLDANAPNFSPTRCQLFGAGNGYTCTGPLSWFAGSGTKFMLTDNSDPMNYLNVQYNRYHVPTDFEYVGLKSELGHGFTLDIKPYTYNYDNNEFFSNAVPMTNDATVADPAAVNNDPAHQLDPTYYHDMQIAPCDKIVTKKGVSALPCGVDKYNSYRKYGETSNLSQVSKFGVLRAGVWYEWAKTNRHQTPSNPLNNWQDQVLPNFNERFWTNSLQPFAEYEFHATNKLKITPGVKFSYYKINTMQWADNGKTLGCLVPGVCIAPNEPGGNPLVDPAAFVRNHGNYFTTLPSIDANYRITNNWSAYGQFST
ncbi:MAG: carboxypeptidase regulatory-like domain-containing protein, partial [Acidobacteriaceae bacterium]|nr:carboxypeptidase regulatory-like domain-containing protein [Acidobacteriaceae bacterium]